MAVVPTKHISSFSRRIALAIQVMNLERRSAADKWGCAGHAGWQAVPDLLLKSQRMLGLTATELLVLLNVTMHWWYADQRPFPRSSAIAKRMGIDTRTAQRAMWRLRKRGYMEKILERGPDGEEREVCDLSGLIRRLDEIAQTDADYLYRSRAGEFRNAAV